MSAKRTLYYIQFLPLCFGLWKLKLKIHVWLYRWNWVFAWCVFVLYETWVFVFKAFMYLSIVFTVQHFVFTLDLKCSINTFCLLALWKQESGTQGLRFEFPWLQVYLNTWCQQNPLMLIPLLGQHFISY